MALKTAETCARAAAFYLGMCQACSFIPTSKDICMLLASKPSQFLTSSTPNFSKLHIFHLRF